jgi:hypothetical protein
MGNNGHGKGKLDPGDVVHSALGPDTFVGVKDDEPVLFELVKVLIVVEQDVESFALHDLRGEDFEQDLILIEPLCFSLFIQISHIQLLDGPGAVLFLAGVNNRHDEFDELAAGFVQDVRMVDDLLVEVNGERKSAGDPVAVELDYRDVDEDVLGVVLRHGLESEVLEDKGEVLAGVQVEHVAVVDDLVEFGLHVTSK